MSCQKCGGEHSTMACDDEGEQRTSKAQSSFAAPAGSARREALVAAVKRDIKNVAHIYPTAFNLYDEPLDRLARRVVATMEAQNLYDLRPEQVDTAKNLFEDQDVTKEFYEGKALIHASSREKAEDYLERFSRVIKMDAPSVGSRAAELLAQETKTPA